MQKAGRFMLSDRQKNAHSLFGEMRQYSDLYQAANAHFAQQKADRKLENEKLDSLFEKRDQLYEQIGALKAKRRFEGLSFDEKKKLDGLYAQVETINSDPLVVKKRKAAFERKTGAAYNKAADGLKVELYELYLADTRFLPKERDEFLAKHKDLIKNMRFVHGKDIFTFVKCPDTIQYHWVKN